MAPAPIQWHTPAKRAPNAPEVPHWKWERYRELLKQLYMGENKTLDQVMDHMSTQFGFSPSCVHNGPLAVLAMTCPAAMYENLLTAPFSKRQYTLQFKHWHYYKKSSRRRPLPTDSDPPTPLSIPDIPSEKPTHGIKPRDINPSPSPVISEREAQPDTHAPIAGQPFSEVHLFIMEPPAQPPLSAGTTLSTVNEYQYKAPPQGIELMMEDEIHSDELSEGPAPLSLCVVPDDPKSRLLFAIDEEDLPNPSLTRTSRTSTDDSSSLDCVNLSSFGSGSNEVHALMNVEDFGYAATSYHSQVGIEFRNHGWAANFIF
jgi:Clr5 domain